MDRFEQVYLSCRALEQRLMTDEVVRSLPHVPRSHPHYWEWKVRAHSANKLINYLKSKKISSILDLGCGTGWLANRLKVIAPVTAVDRQGEELKQGRRIFSDIDFRQGNVMEVDFLRGKKFQVIILASVVQYFENLSALLDRLMTFLDKDGEIHIIDSPIYESAADAFLAKERSDNYYSRHNSKMDQYYFHHHSKEFADYQVIRYERSDTFWRKLIRKMGIPSSPFPWICIKRD